MLGPTLAGPGVMRLPFCFQAEDGMRDIGVTGVQTCALPILSLAPPPAAAAPVAGVVADIPITASDLARIRQSRVRTVRVFMFTPDYNDAVFRDVVARLRRIRVKPVFVVVARRLAPPRTAPEITAYARFVAARARQFRGRVGAWELWNEPDSPGWWAGRSEERRVGKEGRSRWSPY